MVASSLSQVSIVFTSTTFWEVVDSALAFSMISVFLVPVIAGVILWFLAPKIALRVNKESNEGQLPEEKAIVSAGTFLIGIYWAVRSINSVLSQYSATETVNYVGIIILGISVFLILGSNFVAHVYTWLRRYGVDA